MVEVMQFIFQDFWHWAGTVILLSKEHIEETLPLAWDASRKPVICIETGRIYKSCTDASRKTGANRSHIGQCALGKRKTAGGLHWQWRSIKED